MWRYAAGRIGQAVLVLWAAYTVTFLILNLLPSDPVALRLAGANVQVATLTPSQLAQMKAQFGLDKPVIVQYGDMLWNALHLDFGQSSALSLPVSTVLGQKLPTTLTLAVVAVVFMLVLGVGLACLAVYTRWRPLKALLTRVPSVWVSLPTFWVGLLLIQVFSFWLRWVPPAGTPNASAYVMPALAMALPYAAMLAQVLIRGLERTLGEPYITTARAKGLSRAVIQFRHAFRNAAVPSLALLGVLVGNTVVNAVVVETVFSVSGIGQLAQNSVLAQDVPMVQGIVLVASAVFVGFNLIVDLIYPLLDPRIAYTPKVA